MFDIHCHVCQQRYLVGTRSITSLHDTSNGPVAYVRCPAGHHVVHEFRAGATEPRPSTDGAVVVDAA